MFKPLNSSELSIRLVNESSQIKHANSEILLARKPTGISVPGAVIETALRSEDYYLLVLSNDITFEDSLFITLLNRDLKRLDKATIEATETADSFSDLKLKEPNIVQFNFMGVWHIEILDKPVYQLPFFNPVLIKRKMKQHFKLMSLDT